MTSFRQMNIGLKSKDNKTKQANFKLFSANLLQIDTSPLVTLLCRQYIRFLW